MRSRLFFILSFAVLSASGQESKWSYGVTLIPSYLSYWPVGSDSFSEYKGRTNIGLGLILSHQLSNKVSIFLSPEYHTRNFQRVIDIDALRARNPDDDILVSSVGEITYKQKKRVVDIGLGVSYHPTNNFLVTSRLYPSFLISESAQVEPSVVPGNKIGISELNWLVGIGPGYRINAFKGWNIQVSASIDIWLSKFHDFLPEENPVLFQLKLALLKSRD
ncbi:MAG: hypothetical protein AAF843_08830 [Bacteroidota bacterium]